MPWVITEHGAGTGCAHIHHLSALLVHAKDERLVCEAAHLLVAGERVIETRARFQAQVQ